MLRAAGTTVGLTMGNMLNQSPLTVSLPYFDILKSECFFTEPTSKKITLQIQQSSVCSAS